MTNLRSSDFLVLGGGLAGLTFALEAARAGRTVAVLESDAQVGGLARTLVFGDYRFDIGGHRFHSRWPHVRDWALDVMGDDMLEVGRHSRIYLGGRYVDYPLQLPNALTALSVPRATRVLASYLRASLLRNPRRRDVSFEDWVSRRFGQALYDIYFRPYTEKVWGIRCAELSADWASQRIKVPSLGSAIMDALGALRRVDRRAAPVSRFLYPRLGIGMFAERLAEKALLTGHAEISLKSHVIRLEPDKPSGWQVRYCQDGQERTLIGQQVISTIPLGRLIQMLPATGEALPPMQKLTYRGLLCVFLAVEGGRVSPDTWTYFSDGDTVFGRIHEPANWSAEMAPPGNTSLCVEIFSSPGEEVWQRADNELLENVLADLSRLGLLTRGRVHDAWVLRVPHAYPVYRSGYLEELRSVHDYLAHWPTLHLAGRTGSFRYMNMDEVFKESIDLARTLKERV